MNTLCVCVTNKKRATWLKDDLIDNINSTIQSNCVVWFSCRTAQWFPFPSYLFPVHIRFNHDPIIYSLLILHRPPHHRHSQFSMAAIITVVCQYLIPRLSQGQRRRMRERRRRRVSKARIPVLVIPTTEPHSLTHWLTDWVDDSGWLCCHCANIPIIIEIHVNP